MPDRPLDRSWPARLILMRQGELDDLEAALAGLHRVGIALAYDEPLGAEIRRMAAVLRDRINERESDLRELEIARREGEAA